MYLHAIKVRVIYLSAYKTEQPMLKAIQPPLTHVGFYIILVVMILLLILPITATPGAFEIVSLTSDIYKVRGGQTARITVRIRNNLGFTASAVVVAYSENKVFYPGREVVTITLRPGEEGDVYFGAYYGGDEEKTDEIVVIVKDAEGNECDRKTITLRTAPPLPLMRLEGVTKGFLESGKWIHLNITVYNYQVRIYETEVRVKAPQPFRVEPTGIIKPCGAGKTVFTFQITVDTSKEVNGTLEILLCYEDDIIDRSYVSITGYPSRQQESSASSSLPESLIFFVLIFAVAIILFYSVRTRSRRNTYVQLPPPPPP